MPRRPDSQPRISAGIEPQGKTLRYCEVEHPDDPDDEASPPRQPRLLRMGACDFDFDVEEALLDPAAPSHLTVVAEAVKDIFAGSKAARLGVAVHPWHSTSFFSPLPAGTPAGQKLEQLRQEAAMLADERLTRTMPVTATPVRRQSRGDGAEYHWHHVLRVREAAQARVGHLAGSIRSGIAISFVDATDAAANVLARQRSPEDRQAELEAEDEISHTLAVGLYGGRVETSLARGGDWLFGHWAVATEPEDGAYAACALLDLLRLDASALSQWHVYGEEAPQRAFTEAVERLVGAEASVLSPLSLFGGVRSAAKPESLAAFTPCVGAAFRA